MASHRLELARRADCLPSRNSVDTRLPSMVQGGDLVDAHDFFVGLCLLLPDKALHAQVVAKRKGWRKRPPFGGGTEDAHPRPR